MKTVASASYIAREITRRTASKNKYTARANATTNATLKALWQKYAQNETTRLKQYTG